MTAAAETRPLAISVAFAPTIDTPAHVELAETLGYRRAWLYDTPQQGPDVWMCLALAARRTDRIGLGPGVLVPTLRHPMVNAAATAALYALAPGRVAVAFGTGFSGRRAMGQRAPVGWAYMERYVTAFRQLLHGDDVLWDGGILRMLHDATAGAPRPVPVPVYVAALGPTGLDVARRLADGLFITGGIVPDLTGFDRVASLGWGTVLDAGEDLHSQRVAEAAGPGWAQVLHGAYEMLGPGVVAALPGGETWLHRIDAEPDPTRHLAVHGGHCLRLNDADRAAWDIAGPASVEQLTLTGRAAQVRARAEALAAAGVTELVYQPVGDIPRELSAFASALSVEPHR